MFRSLTLKNWRQFGSVDISFHEQLTILTGANGAGKTTILNLLARHLGWAGHLVSTRRKAPGSYSAGNWRLDGRQDYLKWYEWQESSLEDDAPEIDVPMSDGESEIGAIGYAGGDIAQLYVPAKVGTTYQVRIKDQREVPGLHIPSHRPIYSYQQVESIPTVPRRRDQMFNDYVNIVRARFLGQHHQRTPNYFLKETLIGLAVFGAGNRHVAPDLEARETFQSFQEMLRTILPPSLGFRRLLIRVPEVILLTRSGEVPLDALSGGVASLIDIAWQIFCYGGAGKRFVATFDEPENHLHPELQRRVLWSLLKAFPAVQFIVATHNPFIVGSIPDSSVYVLRFGNSGSVDSELLDAANRAGSANEILRSVLGVDSVSPIWVENKFAEVVRQFSQQELNEETVRTLRERLSEFGMSESFPETLAQILAKSRQ